MLKKMTALVIALVFGLFSCQAVAEAMQKDDTSVELQYTHIAAISGSFDIRDGKALCFGSGRSRYTETTTVIYVALQRRTANSNVWMTVCSWSETASGKTTACVDEEKKVSTGYNYRIYIKCTIKDSSGAIKETDSMYSRVISY